MGPCVRPEVGPVTRRYDNGWHFQYRLQSARDALRAFKYEGIFSPRDPLGFGYMLLPRDTLAVGQIAAILSPESLGAPHGLDLLQEPPAPEFSVPERPEGVHTVWITDAHKELTTATDAKRAEITAQRELEAQQAADIAQACKEGDVGALQLLMLTTFIASMWMLRVSASPFRSSFWMPAESKLHRFAGEITRVRDGID